MQRFVAPAGTVMFLDSGRCSHFGSRKPANPRYQLQYAYVSPIRNDFSDLIRPQVWNSRPIPTTRCPAASRSTGTTSTSPRLRLAASPASRPAYPVLHGW